MQFNHDSTTFFYDDSLEDFESNESLLREMKKTYHNAKIGHVEFYKKNGFILTNVDENTLAPVWMHVSAAKLPHVSELHGRKIIDSRAIWYKIKKFFKQLLSLKINRQHGN